MTEKDEVEVRMDVRGQCEGRREKEDLRAKEISKVRKI